MEYQKLEEKILYLKTNIEPDIDRDGERSYRAAARLRDDTFLPCVRFSNPETAIKSALEQFELVKAGKIHYYGIDDTPEQNFQMEVKRIVTYGNRVSHYDIARIEPSPFAFTPGVLRQIGGETTMGYTGFAAQMRDGKYFGFGARNFDFAFFAMPGGYSPADIIKIVSNAYVLKTGEVRQHQLGFYENPPDFDQAGLHTSRIFFECFMEEL
jgi:hypothetical protein